MDWSLTVAVVVTFAVTSGILWFLVKKINQGNIGPWDWAAQCTDCGYGEYRDPDMYISIEDKEQRKHVRNTYICPNCGHRYWVCRVGRRLQDGKWEWREEE